MDSVEEVSSRCSNPEGAPYKWYCYVDESHPSVEALETWLDSLSFFLRHHELGRVDNLFRLASEGGVWESNDDATQVKPITSDPELYELRHKVMTLQLRFYHAEPDHRPEYLIALHRHTKNDARMQQGEIDFAVKRYRAEAT